MKPWKEELRISVVKVAIMQQKNTWKKYNHVIIDFCIMYKSTRHDNRHMQREPVSEGVREDVGYKMLPSKKKIVE